ncbi:DsbA family protein [Litoreibacter roseus]|uniref:DSBA oxidoreductase n=1 Tax=Litoreibacter roseus TaxID=2601869 RepID=A0A6N6JCD2_9RHOB|nr:DsbA family protein [Litoreibacter roseus]GFE63983.1 DSBA oxidoreductase [Litoreibacter roseus]
MKTIASAVLALGLAAGSATAQTADDAALREMILETIRENPEIVAEALQILRDREEAESAEEAKVAVAANRELLENDANAPVIGNPDGDVTVVEFFDYNCGYCRRVFSNVKDLVESDPNVRVVLREWPILGEESVFAARASLASRAQGKYEEFHVALMENRGRATEESVLQIAADIGLDVEKLRVDMDAPEVVAHIATSQRLSQALGVNGTPAFVFGETLMPGAIELDQMKELVDGIRQQG